MKLKNNLIILFSLREGSLISSITLSIKISTMFKNFKHNMSCANVHCKI